ncbi:MAG: phosphate ABC transporter permease PstA [Fibrobacter sp.]|nr:phosphate ABC transporter permease PstA [Fibrobacter sp.]
MKTLRYRYILDRLFLSFLVINTIIVILPLLIMSSYVIVNGISALNLDLFTQELGSPTRAMQGQPTGLVHTMAGTLVVDIMALLFAIPVGLGTGILLSEYPDHILNPVLRIMNDTLNGMPAVLKGLLAFVLIVKPMGTFSGISGSAALAIVMLPIIARSTESALSIIPWSIREAGLALGLPRWRVVLSAIVPAARTGLITGFLIAFSRAAGEAAPLLFTSFGNNYLPKHWTGMFFGPVDTLPQRLYSLAISPYEHWHRMGWAAAIVLFGFVVISFVIAHLASGNNLQKKGNSR